MKSLFAEAMEQIDGCTRCPLSNFRKNIVTYRGNPASELMLVGEAPGGKEDSSGFPMIGPTGSYIVNIFKRNGFTLDDFYITNTLLCRPIANADPTKEQIEACAEWLNLQIELVKPKVIVAVGRIAAARLIPEFAIKKMMITKVEGTTFVPPHLRGIKVIPIRHPSAIMRNSSQKGQYEEAMAEVCGAIRMMLSEVQITPEAPVEKECLF